MFEQRQVKSVRLQLASVTTGTGVGIRERGDIDRVLEKNMELGWWCGLAVKRWSGDQEVLGSFPTAAT